MDVPKVTETVQLIVDMAKKNGILKAEPEKKVEKERLYKIGDVFRFVGSPASRELRIIVRVTDGEGNSGIGFTGLGNSEHAGTKVHEPASVGINLSDLSGIPEKYEYLGHFSELSFIKGHIVTDKSKC